jgi:hypothetical protein
MKFDGRKWVAGAVAVVASVGAFAQGSGSSDPTSSIVSTLGTYATDVATLAAAILLIFYGKQLVAYLKVR